MVARSMRSADGSQRSFGSPLIAPKNTLATMDTRALADITLPDQDGNEVELGDLWRERPVALVWLRHYG
jgi:hypothetical protein